MPFCDGCYEVPFRNAAEVLDFAGQVPSVSSRLFWFSKICMRFMNTGTMFLAWSSYCTSGGTVHRIWLFSSDYCQGYFSWKHSNESPRHYSQLWLFSGGKVVEFRSTFLVEYLLVDFGFSSYTHLGPNSGLLVDPLPTGRSHRAPESVRSKFDPFAVDVYQTARLLYAWIHVRSFISDLVCVVNPYWKEIVLEIPELLELLQDEVPQPKTTHVNVSGICSLTMHLYWYRELGGSITAFRP